MRLWLTPAQTDLLLQQAIHAAPNEACGVLAGTDEQVCEVIPVPNIATNPLHHYRMDDQAYSKALFELQKKRLSIIGFYHSHPVSEPIPSSEDIRQAHYPDTPYVIVGLRQRDSRIAAWNIRYGQVTPVELYVGSEAPEAEEPLLSPMQIRAIILSAVIAFVFMIILSLSLLPPAPIIVTPFP